MLASFQFAEKIKAKDACVMPVRKVKVKRVAANYRGVFYREIIRHLTFVKDLFACPFINAPGTGAGSPELGGRVARLGTVRPADAQFPFAFFYDLQRFYHFFKFLLISDGSIA